MGRLCAAGRLEPDHRFIDDGYSGATLIRPALERLRDAIAAGAIDRLYVHSPDRLARRYAYQVLLIDEFQRAGIEVAFLNRPLGRSAEDDLLWVDTWNDGKVHLYDIRDPHAPKQVFEQQIGEQLNMVSESWDGKRIYFTSSLLAN